MFPDTAEPGSITCSFIPPTPDASVPLTVPVNFSDTRTTSLKDSGQASNSYACGLFQPHLHPQCTSWEKGENLTPSPHWTL